MIFQNLKSLVNNFHCIKNSFLIRQMKYANIFHYTAPTHATYKIDIAIQQAEFFEFIDLGQVLLWHEILTIL